ncbi:hypothetical protein STVIR_4493 [Streptomyces viridochromogenes Tue57]|uniref:Uncharacterized protein n=1 Tax=Streptomyces viridochromogenes Tue57 TaxID=1160705 RepID=L8PGR9_STRVR|nr:hypothetical protein STVIR_4493 [Streptomyces viridochromogenes Tue57]
MIRGSAGMGTEVCGECFAPGGVCVELPALPGSGGWK